METRFFWDIRALVRACGGVENFRRQCLAFGYEVPLAGTVRQWQSRGSAPPDGIAHMLAVIRKLDPEVEVFSFIRILETKESVA